MKQNGCAQFLISVALFFTPVSMAEEYIWDQINDSTIQGGQSIQSFSPIGQEFIPSLDCLEVLQLHIQNESGYSEFMVNIYPDSITGHVLGTSNVVAVSEFYFDVLTFTFETVILLPHNLYVMEILQTVGLNGGVSHCGSNTYPLGRQILSGVPQEGNDLWFREGVLEGTVLDRLSWGSIKCTF